MEIERMKRLLKSGIEAGNKTRAVREVIKTHENRKQDIYDDTAEILKPSIDVQKSVKESIDQKQDELIEQLQKKQKAIASGLEDIAMMNALPAALPAPIETTKLPIDYKPKMIDELEQEEEEDEEEDEEEQEEEQEKDNKPSKKVVFNINKGITEEYRKTLERGKYPLPSDIMNEGEDVEGLIKKVTSQINRAKKYIKSNSTKKGEPLKRLSKAK